MEGLKSLVYSVLIVLIGFSLMFLLPIILTIGTVVITIYVVYLLFEDDRQAKLNFQKQKEDEGT